MLIACPAVCITCYLPTSHQLQHCCCNGPVIPTEQHVHRHSSDRALSGASEVCYALFLQWFRGQVQNLVHVHSCQRGFKCSDITATKNLRLLWGRGGCGTIIDICENKHGLYKTNNKEIVKFCVFEYSDIFSPS